MLESRPPDRKLETGTSAIRCAATDSSITARRSAGSPAAASAAMSATFQYACTSAVPSGRKRAQHPAGSLRTWSMAQRCSGSQ